MCCSSDHDGTMWRFALLIIGAFITIIIGIICLAASLTVDPDEEGADAVTAVLAVIAGLFLLCGSIFTGFAIRICCTPRMRGEVFRTHYITTVERADPSEIAVNVVCETSPAILTTPTILTTAPATCSIPLLPIAAPVTCSVPIAAPAASLIASPVTCSVPSMNPYYALPPPPSVFLAR